MVPVPLEVQRIPVLLVADDPAVILTGELEHAVTAVPATAVAGELIVNTIESVST